MKFSDIGIVLSHIKYGDTSIIVKIFSQEHGIIKGLVNGQKKNSAILQTGNQISFEWNGRLEEHLGKLKPEIEKAYPLLFFSNYVKLISISSICKLIELTIPEKDPSPEFFKIFINYLENLNSEEWLKNYCLLELEILKNCGFGLDFSECAVSGSSDKLIYISPKTGAAVTKEVGEKYHEKLFKIPEFYHDNKIRTNITEILESLRITRYFLAKDFFAENGKKIPDTCGNFLEEVSRIKS